MRCFSCEALLDRYVGADLERVLTAAVALHLRDCAPCEALHRRLRIVDALLATARTPVLDADFTRDVMLRVRTMAPPSLPRRHWLPLAAFYLVAAWIVAGAVYALALPGAFPQTHALAQTFTGSLAALAHGTRALVPVEPVALSIVLAVLAIDALLFAAVVAFYKRVRPRLTAYLAAEARS